MMSLSQMASYDSSCVRNSLINCCVLSNQTQVDLTRADRALMSTIGSINSSVNLPSAQTSGLNAIAAGTQKLNADAQQIANPNGTDDTAPLVDLNQALVLAQAGANVISTENKLLGSLIDALA